MVRLVCVTHTGESNFCFNIFQRKKNIKFPCSYVSDNVGFSSPPMWQAWMVGLYVCVLYTKVLLSIHSWTLNHMREFTRVLDLQMQRLD